MHPIGKIIIGAILIIGSVYYVISGIEIPGVISLAPAWPAFLTVLKGAVPPLVFLLGVFIVWLELDELRIERELRAEERKAKRRRKKR